MNEQPPHIADSLLGDDPRFRLSVAGARKFKGIAHEVRLLRARRAEPDPQPASGVKLA